jgi:hypothetical protein
LWFAVAVVLVAWAFVDKLTTSHPLEPSADDLVVAGVVTGEDRALRMPVKYTHPTTQQEIELDVVVHRSALRSQPGSTVELIVSPDDPDDVHVLRDRSPASDVAWELTPLAGFPLAVYLRRRWHRHRIEKLIADDTPSFAMLGALGPPRAGGTRPLLSLYALDAPAGAEPICSVPVLTTHGAPFGAVLPIEVKGSPRTHGRVVARHREVLWPTGRATGRGGIDRPLRHVEAVDEPGTDPLAIDAPPWSRWVKVWQVEWIVLAGSLALIAVAGIVTAVKAHDARALERNGTPVVVTVTKRGESVLDVTYTNGLDGREIVTTTPVQFPEDYTVGRRYPARVDPNDPARLRLLAEPYDAVEPVVWASVPFVVVSSWLASRAVRFWRARRAINRAPTRHFGGRVVRVGKRVVDLDIGMFDEPGPRCTVRIALNELPHRFHGTVLVRGSAEPGQPLAVRRDGQSLTVLGPARSPAVRQE